MQELVAPTRLIEEFHRGAHSHVFVEWKPVDKRIHSLVSDQIARQTPSTLLASATSPRVIISGMLGATLQEVIRHQPRPKPALRKAKAGRQVPIGLNRCPLFPPINAVMQLTLFLPIFRELFAFAPRSYAALSDFLDQYAFDQENILPISTADSSRLCRLLIQKMEGSLFDRFEVLPFIQGLVRTVLGKAPHSIHEFVWDTALPFSTATDIPSRPHELFVTIRNRLRPESCHMIQRQFFTKPDSYCYDLDAFVEFRPDGQWGDYITYLKVDGSWYQCDDERISQMRSTHLNMVLHRGVLLHYQRIWPK